MEAQKNPDTERAVAGSMTHQSRNTQRNCTAEDNALALLVAAQSVAAGMLLTIDHIQESITRAAGGES